MTSGNGIKRKFDVVEECEAFAQEAWPYTVPSAQTHKHLLGYDKGIMDGVGATSPLVIDAICQRMLLHFRATAESRTQFERERRIIEIELWPRMAAYLAFRPATAGMMLEYGCESRYLMPFVVNNLKNNMALSLLAAHFVGTSVTGDFVPIPRDDPAFYFCATEASFVLARQRTQAIQAAIQPANRVLALGGGLAPELWVRGFKLRPEQQVWIVEQADLEKQLKRLMEDVDFEQHVRFQRQDFNDFFARQPFAEPFDLTYLAGIAAYHKDNLDTLFANVATTVRPGGLVLADACVAHEGYVFDIDVMGWSPQMYMYASVLDAQQAMSKAMEAAGLKVVRMFHDERVPAGIMVWAAKQ